ncbi:AsnC family transcriptional regulator [Streptomyces sp. NPDC026672]|uniref:Lrp/AsnC family transcriptional regulator n=1 Tax=unclassified Streptomyces TaxID=2593676 RepID=UPI0033D5B1D3
MLTSDPVDSHDIDRTDARIIRCLQLSPRAGFARIASVLGVSEPTVARRYRRLTRTGVVRVLGVTDPQALGESTWMVRVKCRPHGTSALADSLARRDDVSWVALSAGGSEVNCVVRSLSAEQREDLLVRRLPRTTPVLGLDAAIVLHQYVGGSARYRSLFADALTDDEAARLGTAPAPDAPRRTVELEPHDLAVMDVLARDGRTGYAELAAAAGISEGRASRSLAALLEYGIVGLDVDLAPAAFGYQVRANLWLRVAPAHLDGTGAALSALPEVTFAAAVSGPHNVFVAVMCHTLDELFGFLSTRIGALTGVQTADLVPLLLPVKQSGARMDGDRFSAVSYDGPRGR